MRFAIATVVSLIAAPTLAATLTGKDAYGDWKSDAPGVTRKLTPDDLPPPGAALTFALPQQVARPAGAELKLPPGFSVSAFAQLDGPRQVRVAPNGDIFVAEMGPGRIKVLRAADGAAKAAQTEVFAEGLDRPFGIAFYPAGPNPQWVYIANTNSVIRFPYRNGDLKARAAPEVLVPAIAPSKGGNHVTRDIAFSGNGTIMFVSVGSFSNVGEELAKKSAAEASAWQAQHALGAAWGKDENRADVLAFDPLGKGGHVFAAGIRNCVSMAVNPANNALWCVTNERDLLGDNLPPDYATSVKPGAFYGWPWYYIGAHEDPRRAGERPDLKDKIAVPDVLLQPHSAPLGVTFYEATSGAATFPAAYRGQAFVALHGSWNRSKRTGYKVVIVKFNHGQPTGEYEDFLTGFVVDDRSVWGRPVGVAVAHDGALLVSDDGGNTLWRVAYAQK
ncbi:MAG TPA: PQQ-dependent sugar dehydrogenase [Caulobacteraceae bacterium]|nr:PQQ-dependent sugar dehydrogenase [Caulobacteraceae bacterium]